MATVISSATGNFTASGTWSLVDSTSFSDVETNNTALTTSFVSSSNFTPGIITIDGIGVKIASRAASPTGTMSVRLFNASGAAAVAGTTVTINVSDITASPSGWYLFKFSAPVALAAATNYNVQATTSSAAQVNLFRDNTSNNWSRVLRTTTAQAPASTDKMIVAGEWTAAATSSTFTVTMDSVSSATTYGELQICNKGVLTWGTTVSNAYYLKLAGLVNIYDGGTLNIGTSLSSMPSSSSGTLEFVCSTPVQYGLEAKALSTLVAYGATKTVQALLAADAAASATSLTTNVSTSWSNGDVIALASTTRTASQSESKALTAGASGTTLTITALTNAHLGTAPIQAELGNLTRNVKIFSNDATNTSYINIATSSNVDVAYVEFTNLGSATASKRGVDIATTAAGMCSFVGCSLHDFTPASSQGFNITGGSADDVTLNNNVLYNIAATAITHPNTTGSNITITNNLMILNTSGFSATALRGTYTGNVNASSSSNGISLAASSNIGTISNLTSHSCTLNGFVIAGLVGNGIESTTISNLIGYRNTTGGFVYNAQSSGFLADSWTAFGNATGFTITNTLCNIRFLNLSIYAGTTLTQATGISIGATMAGVIMDNGVFGSPSTHATADVTIAATAFADVLCRNCLFNSTNEITSTSSMMAGSSIKSQKHDQTVGNHKTYKTYGTISSDSTIFNFASPSVRLTPSSASGKLQGTPRKIAVLTGQTAQVSVYVRKSVVGDGTVYNGNQPRLMLKLDPSMGVTADTVLATATNAANGAFELITGVTPAITDNGAFQVYLDCDGTTGWVNIDDWLVY